MPDDERATAAGGDIDARVRAGVAVYNAGFHHAAHDVWEERWLGLDAGDDERFLHGLIQFTAAVHHARDANWEGARGLAASARDYLADLPATYRGVDVEAMRSYLAAAAADPVHTERVAPPALSVDGDALQPSDLDLDAALAAAPALAEGVGVDERVAERAVDYARADFADGDEGSDFVTLVLDFVRDSESRAIVHQRLSERVDRRRRRDRDVEGLFE